MTIVRVGLLLFQAVMIGDDIVSDIGGAQASGIRGVQVRSGKYRFTIEQPYQHCYTQTHFVLPVL